MFNFFSTAASRLRREEKGATAVEYGIMVALIAVVIIGAVSLLGTGMKDMFTQAQCSVTGGTFTAAQKAQPAGTNTDGTPKAATPHVAASCS